jgi:precorrin-6Y C5,15-methyltransferase (decarboxylating)
MAPIHVVGIGLEGSAGLPASVRECIDQAAVLMGNQRHISYFPNHPGTVLPIENFATAIAQLRQYLSQSPPPRIVVLTSGDPLFFGLGRLLLAELPADSLTFHPHLSAIQLAFSRLKLPWQDAVLVSAHGRPMDELVQALHQGAAKIAVLTDPNNTPGAIARLIRAMGLADRYQLWVCENLGSSEEQVTHLSDLLAAEARSFAALNVVVLFQKNPCSDLEPLPLLGLPDRAFLSFADRPNLMTKREIRVLVLAELALEPHQVIWDVGAGTGSVAIEIARLCPTCKIYAIEKTAAGASLIQENCQRFQLSTIVGVQGTAPEVLAGLPNPDRIFIGGSSGHLPAILDFCSTVLQPNGRIVLAIATLEHLSTAISWVATSSKQPQSWFYQSLQINLARSVPVGALTRLTPLNPVTLVVLTRSPSH